jgi:hypothetical protein
LRRPSALTTRAARSHLIVTSVDGGLKVFSFPFVGGD